MQQKPWRSTLGSFCFHAPYLTCYQSRRMYVRRPSVILGPRGNKTPQQEQQQQQHHSTTKQKHRSKSSTEAEKSKAKQREGRKGKHSKAKLSKSWRWGGGGCPRILAEAGDPPPTLEMLGELRCPLSQAPGLFLLDSESSLRLKDRNLEGSNTRRFESSKGWKA